MLVLGTVANNVLDLAVVAADWDRESDNIVAGTDQLEVVLADTGFRGGSVEEELNLL